MDRQNDNQSYKRKQKRRMRLVAFIMASFLAWAGYTWYIQYGILSQKTERLTELKVQSTEMEKENVKLQTKVDKLNNKEYIAELARKNYFLSKPGEIIIVIPEEE